MRIIKKKAIQYGCINPLKSAIRNKTTRETWAYDHGGEGLPTFEECKLEKCVKLPLYSTFQHHISTNKT